MRDSALYRESCTSVNVTRRHETGPDCPKTVPSAYSFAWSARNASLAGAGRVTSKSALVDRQIWEDSAKALEQKALARKRREFPTLEASFEA